MAVFESVSGVFLLKWRMTYKVFFLFFCATCEYLCCVICKLGAVNYTVTFW